VSPVDAAKRLQDLTATRPALAIILGSGFQHALSAVDVEARIDCQELPGFPPVAVTGHAGELIVGRLGGTAVLLLGGRAHYYEGHSMMQVTFPIRALAAFGIRDLLLTNAAGGINPQFHRGDFMVLSDHINLMGMNPLRGESADGQSQFVDLTRAYDPGLSGLLTQAARLSRVKLRSGVYLAVGGPSYETPAEIRAFGRLGADAVGMSTVPEVIVARQWGLAVAGLSCITNLAAGLGKGVLSHQEVLETAARVKAVAAKLLFEFAKLYGAETKYRR
jgi:purine-nucleoside phosphorylase